MWETIDRQTDRMKVPQGWIVRSSVSSGSYQGGVSVHQIFVQDPNHDWVLEISAND